MRKQNEDIEAISNLPRRGAPGGLLATRTYFFPFMRMSPC